MKNYKLTLSQIKKVANKNKEIVNYAMNEATKSAKSFNTELLHIYINNDGKESIIKHPGGLLKTVWNEFEHEEKQHFHEHLADYNGLTISKVAADEWTACEFDEWDNYNNHPQDYIRIYLPFEHTYKWHRYEGDVMPQFMDDDEWFNSALKPIWEAFIATPVIGDACGASNVFYHDLIAIKAMIRCLYTLPYEEGSKGIFRKLDLHVDALFYSQVFHYLAIASRAGIWCESKMHNDYIICRNTEFALHALYRAIYMACAATIAYIYGATGFPELEERLDEHLNYEFRFQNANAVDNPFGGNK